MAGFVYVKAFCCQKLYKYAVADWTKKDFLPLTLQFLSLSFISQAIIHAIWLCTSLLFWR